MAADRAPSSVPRRPSAHRLGLTGLRPRRRWELHPGVRSAARLTRGERAAAWAGDRIGSWTFVVLVVVLLEVGMVAAIRQDEVDGAIALLGVVVSGVVLLELSVVLMSIRRADRTAEELALHHLEATRRTAATLEALGDHVERLGVDLARLDARIRTSTQEPTQRSARDEGGRWP